MVVPEAFAVDTIAREGENGRFWITSLPQIVELLCQLARQLRPPLCRRAGG